MFIDDVLVLDLGGIHGKVSGTINFATGAVTRTDINGGSASGTTIREAFNAANVDGDLKADTNTFSDYSTHTIKFFYLERGNVDSNCMIKFNFPTIPKDSVTIAKEVTDEDGTGIDYADDIDFKFNIKVGNENYKNQQYALWENGKQVLDEQGNPVTGTTDDEGNFTLKHSQMAVFSGLNADTKYQVTELGAYLNGYTVYIDGTEHEVISDTSSGQSVPSAQTRELIVGEDKDVIFRNEIKNRATLSIKKELKEGEQATDEPFQIQVKIQGNLYNGTYSIGSQSGLHANNGIISLKAGETATITGIPYGANFEVEEMLNGTYQPSYSVNGDVTNISVPDQDEDENTVTSASAQIIGEAANVTITNKKLEQGAGTTNVAVEKNWDMTNGTYDYPEYITVTLYKDVNHDGKLDDGDEKVAGQSPIQLSETNGWKGGWTNLPGDTDFVVKEEYPEGYQIKTTEIVNDITDMSYIDVVTNCNNLIWNLKQNNMLVTKKGNNFIVWTIYDLKLTNEEKTQVKDWIAPYVNGNIGSIDFVYGQGGFGENSDITLVQNDDGSWRLEFGAKSTWSQFYYFSYNRTQNITLTNEIISDHKTNVTVTKVWSDGNPNNFSVEVQLLQNGKPYMVEESPATVTLPVNGNDWTYTFTDLPYFSQSSDGKWIINEYTVVETKIGDVSVVNNYANGYISKVTGSMQSGFTITNSRTTPWQIFKVSSVDKTLKLSGAEFKLESTQAEGAESTTVKTYWGRSDSSGVIIWYSDSDFTSGNEVDYIPDDTYTLTETKAPVGYSVSDENWTITISSGNVMILNSDGAVQGENVDGTLTFYYKNTALYSLPSAGSSGIFGYTMGGTLLLMAGTLILYKMKRKEVQES